MCQQPLERRGCHLWTTDGCELGEQIGSLDFEGRIPAYRVDHGRRFSGAPGCEQRVREHGTRRRFTRALQMLHRGPVVQPQHGGLTRVVFGPGAARPILGLQDPIHGRIRLDRTTGRQRALRIGEIEPFAQRHLLRDRARVRNDVSRVFTGPRTRQSLGLQHQRVVDPATFRMLDDDGFRLGRGLGPL